MVSEQSDLTVAKGTCYPLFAYDIAQAIDLDSAEQRILVVDSFVEIDPRFERERARDRELRFERALASVES